VWSFAHHEKNNRIHRADTQRLHTAAVPRAATGNLERSGAAALHKETYDPNWWRQFDDPVLESLEASALQSNHDVRIAVARFDEARAMFSDVALDRFRS